MTIVSGSTSEWQREERKRPECQVTGQLHVTSHPLFDTHFALFSVLMIHSMSLGCLNASLAVLSLLLSVAASPLSLSLSLSSLSTLLQLRKIETTVHYRVTCTASHWFIEEPILQSNKQKTQLTGPKTQRLNMASGNGLCLSFPFAFAL